MVAVAGFGFMRTALCGTRPDEIGDMKPEDHPAPLAPLAHRPRDAAKALGISERTLWTWTNDGIIPCVRVGSGKRRVVLYPVADLQAWLARRATTATEGGAK